MVEVKRTKDLIVGLSFDNITLQVDNVLGDVGRTGRCPSGSFLNVIGHCVNRGGQEVDPGVSQLNLVELDEVVLILVIGHLQLQLLHILVKVLEGGCRGIILVMDESLLDMQELRHVHGFNDELDLFFCGAVRSSFAEIKLSAPAVSLGGSVGSFKLVVLLGDVVEIRTDAIGQVQLIFQFKPFIFAHNHRLLPMLINN